MLAQKSAPNEHKLPVVSADIPTYHGENVKIVFNRTRNHFKYDCIDIFIGDHRAVISRDHLAAAIINGHKLAGSPDDDET